MRMMTRGRRTHWLVFSVFAVAALIGFVWLRWYGNAWRALDDADQYELLSLQPSMLRMYVTEPNFCGHEILGSTIITDSDTRKKLNTALREGVRESDGRVMACFNPRHGIRVTRAGVVTEFVICFECRQSEIWRGGKQIAFYPIIASPQPVFDEVLEKANVPLASKDR